MNDIRITILLILFAAALAAWVLSGLEIRKLRRELRSFRKEEKPETPEMKEEEIAERNPMSLRNGYGVTKQKDPTFAEQIMNVINYRGENQLEEDYEDERIEPAEDMG